MADKTDNEGWTVTSATYTLKLEPFENHEKEGIPHPQVVVDAHRDEGDQDLLLTVMVDGVEIMEGVRNHELRRFAEALLELSRSIDQTPVTGRLL